MIEETETNQLVLREQVAAREAHVILRACGVKRSPHVLGELGLIALLILTFEAEKESS